MNDNSGAVLFFLCIAAVLAAGCTNQTLQDASIPVPTPSVSIPLTERTNLVIPTTYPGETTTPAVVPGTTLLPAADPTDVSDTTFMHYSDNDFSVDYPATWSITHSTYFRNFCQNVFDDSRMDYHVCYENETKSIGPFNFYEDDTLRKPSRIVTFTSADGTLKFVSFISDFLDTVNSQGRRNSSVEWARSEFELRYPDLSASSYVTNTKFFRSGNFLISTFDVILPDGTRYYPTAYTGESVITLHRVYAFAFTTDTKNFDKYRNLKDRIITSIKINDLAWTDFFKKTVILFPVGSG
jgi:hypothetical protein